MKIDEIGLDPNRDYMDPYHTNIHGAIKYTRFVASYLVKEYGLTDKKELSEYASFEKAWQEYREELSPYILSEELTA